MTNTVTTEYIEDLLNKAEVEEHIISGILNGEKSLVVSYKLENGWQIVEKAGLVNLPESMEIARRFARDKAASELEMLERYLLHSKLYEEQKLQAKLHEVNKLV